MTPAIETPANPADFTALTFLSLRPKLEARDPSIVALGATLLGAPAGLCIAQPSQRGRTAEILSIAVVAPHRTRGIATQLLKAMQKELASRGCFRVNIGYSSHSPFKPALGRLLSRLEWEPPKPTAIVCEGSWESISKASWLRPANLPGEFEIFNWDQLTPAEHHNLKHDTWYPDLLSPIIDEDKIFEFSSLGLRHLGEVAGWIIVERLDEKTIRYRSLFVRQELQTLGRGIALLAESILRHRGTSITRAIFTVNIDNERMIRFVHRRMAPYLTSISTTFRATKIIGAR